MLLRVTLPRLILGDTNKLQLCLSKIPFSFHYRSAINKREYRQLTCSTKSLLGNRGNSNKILSGHQPKMAAAQFEPCFTAIRHISQQSNQQVRTTRRHEEDNMSQEYILAYSNSSVRYYRMAQLVLQPTSALSVVGAAYLCYTGKNDFFLSENINYFEHPFVVGCIFIFFNSYLFYVVTNLCQSYLLRIYVHPNEKNFVAIVPGLLGSNSKLHFTAEDVTVSSRKYIIPFKRGNSVIKGRSFILHQNDFLIPTYYNALYPVQYDDDDDNNNNSNK